jgi:predicted RND superfamily exporter protein
MPLQTMAQSTPSRTAARTRPPAVCGRRSGWRTAHHNVQDATGAVGLALLFPTRELWTLAERHAVSQRVTQRLTALDVHGSLTGLYTISAASAARTGADFRRITLLAAAWMVVLVALQFRHLPRIGLALLPVGCGTLWTASLCALWGVQLHCMPVAVVPLLLALGIDFGISMAQRVRGYGRSHGVPAVQRTGAAIGLSALTTPLAFGTLALSQNQGLASVGVVTLVGITACLLASLVTLPTAWHPRVDDRPGQAAGPAGTPSVRTATTGGQVLLWC